MKITKVCTVKNIENGIMNYLVSGIDYETEKEIKIGVPYTKAYFSRTGFISLFRVSNGDKSYYVFTGTHALIESEILDIIGDDVNG